MSAAEISKPLSREKTEVAEYYRSSLVQQQAGLLSRDLAIIVKPVDPTLVVQMDQVCSNHFYLEKLLTCGFLGDILHR